MTTPGLQPVSVPTEVILFIGRLVLQLEFLQQRVDTAEAEVDRLRAHLSENHSASPLIKAPAETP